MNFIEMLKSKKQYDTNKLQLIKTTLSKAPEGSLVYTKSHGHTNYYHAVSSTRKYIRTDNMKLAAELAAKSYYQEMEPLLKNEVEAIDEFLEKFKPDEPWLVYSRLSNERKELVLPILSAEEQAWADWKDEPFFPYAGHPENLRFTTDRGEKVRSKSEVIIANALNQYSDYLDYRYEKSLWLPSHGIETHPDFTVFIKRTGRIKFWEHAGLMDNPEYSAAHVKKVACYIASGFMPGRDLITTMETAACPLDTIMVKRMIQYIISE